jgi:UDP-N-acetylglucosamine 4,6-dehydratase/5-epimerase
MFENSTLLITGGTGSFGSMATKNFLSQNVREIRVFSRDEKKQDDMRLELDNDKLKFYIGDIRDYNSISQACKGVDYLFHAAALKQVPSCEFYPMEAIKTNIMGSENVIRASINNKVKKVVLLSTDKAVYPINAMGLSKSLMEKCMIANSRVLHETNETVLCATRYGNVMASRGSVIPLFVDQILKNKSLTITDPDMTRFLMSLEDSFDLVNFAFLNGKQGDIFVQKGKSSTILDLAKALKSLFKKNNAIEIMGTRHGEKLFETLISREEMVSAIEMGDYYKIPADDRDLNYGKYFHKGEEKISYQDDYTSHNTRRLNVDEIKELLLSISFVKDKLNA